MGIKKNFGFTLIEIILVIAVMALALPALVNIVFTIVRQQYKIVALQEIKSQGNNALNTMQTVIRNNAIGIYQESSLTTAECVTNQSQYGSNNGSDFFFKDKEGKYFSFYLDAGNQEGENYIASESAAISGVAHLTNNKVMISDFSISCIKTATYSSPVITINFKVSHREGSFLEYNSRVKLRNY